MKEQIHTIPINDAITNAGECPFCYIEKKAEERIMDFVLGASASYMESNIREQTDQAGFCRAHYKKMFDYGNSLGNAWILKTHYKKMIEEMTKTFRDFSPEKSKKSLFRSKSVSTGNPITSWCQEKKDSCYICDTLDRTFHAYIDTFFSMYKKDSDFRNQISSSHGFCISHFGDLCEAADHYLNESELKEFYDMILPLQQTNMERLYEDVSWFIEKYDYKNKDADWKESKDAIQRGMQKLKGGYPADPVYQMKK